MHFHMGLQFCKLPWSDNSHIALSTWITYYSSCFHSLLYLHQFCSIYRMKFMIWVYDLPLYVWKLATIHIYCLFIICYSQNTVTDLTFEERMEFVVYIKLSPCFNKDLICGNCVGCHCYKSDHSFNFHFY